jgi:hypothetical protein
MQPGRLSWQAKSITFGKTRPQLTGWRDFACRRLLSALIRWEKASSGSFTQRAAGSSVSNDEKR